MDGSIEPRKDDSARLPLFRPDVLREQQTQWLGTILLRPGPMHLWFAATAACTIVLVIAVLFAGSYTKTARVAGWLVPAQGLVRVFAPRAGVATTILVREGEQVAQGQVLVALSSEERSAALGETQARVAHALLAQRDSLDAEGDRTRQLFLQQQAALEGRIAAMRQEQRNLEQEITLQKSHLALARQWEQRQRELKGLGFIAEQQVRNAAESAFEQAAKVHALERNLITLGRDRVALEGELKDLPLKVAAQDALVARSIAATSRELAETEARRALLIPAPQAGSVTAVHATPGAAVNPGTPLLSIVPRGAQLEAHLYAPSRAVGFVRAGQQVLLRYRAYPYQKFGHYRGVIKSVSRSAIEPAELPSMYAAGTSGSAAEPLYRITVALARQDVTAYGRPVPLQPGMQLDADVLLERRRLIEWVFDPIFTLTGAWNR
jgi:membrane fusion protein